MVKLKYCFGCNNWAEYYTYEVDSGQIKSALCDIIIDTYGFTPINKQAVKDLVFDIEDNIIEIYYDDLCEYFYEEAYEEYTISRH